MTAMPFWLRTIAPIVFLALIIGGALWLRSMEAKSRRMEAERKKEIGL